jgi:hypothetical protein
MKTAPAVVTTVMTIRIDAPWEAVEADAACIAGEFAGFVSIK